MKSLTLIITVSIFIVFSHATPTIITRLQPHMNQSSALNLTQQQINRTEQVIPCTYMISIKTSCDSPANSKDTIAILFGDDAGNELTMLNVDTPDFHTFERCKVLTFELLGNCMGQICKLYVARVGSDGWIPESITAFYGDYPPITFIYNVFILDDKQGHGFDYCQH
ncbi:embryo-specific protein ATS3A-like [Vicia villosa]|uniref:embryo-specific protein ATS3A-like n=1 Tax=Vicia villosa TaxID=3911 RepID=UPI00273AB71E|nr:embryo-specific protein ATS3A-like [Vicia villosa]